MRISKIDGLKSYKNQSQTHTLHIPKVRELWTRFEVIQGKYLVLKMKYNGNKYEFGIPMSFCGPWVEAFFSLIEDYEQ